MRIEMNPIPMLDLKGTWREMGIQYGQEDKVSILKNVDMWYDICKRFGSPRSFEELLEYSMTFADGIKHFNPDIFEFIEGIAEGAEIGIERAMYLQVGCELLTKSGMEGMAPGVPTVGCTSFAYSSEITEGKKTIFGMNLDMEWGLDAVMLRLSPVNGNKILAYAWSGSGPQVGLSEKGFGVVYNMLGYGDLCEGLPVTAFTQNALMSNIMTDAIDPILLLPRSIAFNYMFASKEDLMLDVEGTPDKYGLVDPENGMLIHTNHYQTVWLQDGSTEFGCDSHIRLMRLCDLARKESGHITVDSCKRFMSDHANYPHGLCKHPDPDVGMSDRTILSIIIVPEDGLVYATEHPCEVPYGEYNI